MDTSKSSGGWFFSVLFLIFLTLKLAEVGVVADWSWWWVFSPLWIPACLVLIVFIIAVLVLLVTGYWSKEKRTYRKVGRQMNEYGRSLRGRL